MVTSQFPERIAGAHGDGLEAGILQTVRPVFRVALPS
jgi:hypothetical protein